MGGVFHVKGWESKSFAPRPKDCLPWFSRERSWDIPGILPGYPGPLVGLLKSLCKKTFVQIFRSLNSGAKNQPEVFEAHVLAYMLVFFQSVLMSFWNEGSCETVTTYDQNWSTLVSIALLLNKVSEKRRKIKPKFWDPETLVQCRNS